MKIYTLRRITVICPSCDLIFATTQVARMPKISKESKVEADLHRILPDSAVRAALLGTCPECLFTWWLSTFAPSLVLPQMAPDSPPVANSKKFGHAILTGRNEGAHALDLAVVALNGYWSAREEFQEGRKWLELAAQDLEKALADESWWGNRSRYNYILGEVLRLTGNFHGAVRHFNQVDRKSVLPKELVEHQIFQAKQGNDKPVLLPPHIIQAVFKLKPEVEEQAQVNQPQLSAVDTAPTLIV